MSSKYGNTKNIFLKLSKHRNKRRNKWDNKEMSYSVKIWRWIYEIHINEICY
jgi:hypothetical protein